MKYNINVCINFQIASVIFLDQPVNTGFSYATNSAAYKYTNVQVCEYVYEFLRKVRNF